MNSRVNIKNVIAYIRLTCVNAALIFAFIPHNVYGVDMDGDPAVIMLGAWISNTDHDDYDNERLVVLHVYNSEPTSFSLTEYVRKEGLKDNPDVWSKSNKTEERIVDEVALSVEGRKLTLGFEENEANWPIEYHRHSERYRQPEHGADESVPRLTDTIGQWMCYSVDSQDGWMADPLLWMLSISDNKTFSLRMYSYDQRASPDGWSLMLKLVGDMTFDPGGLDVKRVYNVPSGSLERWRGETPLLTHNLEMVYKQDDDALIVSFPADREDRKTMVLTFFRN